jgi:hypothetical protein
MFGVWLWCADCRVSPFTALANPVSGGCFDGNAEVLTTAAPDCARAVLDTAEVAHLAAEDYVEHASGWRLEIEGFTDEPGGWESLPGCQDPRAGAWA